MFVEAENERAEAQPERWPRSKHKSKSTMRSENYRGDREGMMVRSNKDLEKNRQIMKFEDLLLFFTSF